MSRTKIAPTLQEHLARFAPSSAGVAAWLPVARAELLALLAVVSAASDALDREAGLAGVRGGILADPSAFTPEDVRTARALARLDRLSSPPSRRGSLRKGSTVEGNDTLPANSRRTARAERKTR